MKVHILVLNYNGAKLLEECLPSMTAATQKSAHQCFVSVVDNASADDSRRAAEKAAPKAGWIQMRDNRVLCAYNEVAKALDDDILILMNNDIKADPGFVDPLIEPFIGDPKVFFVTTRCLSEATGAYEGNRTRAQLRLGVFWSASVYSGHEKAAAMFGPTFQGGFGAFDRKKFLEIGGYDDLYLPGRLEDADICFLAHKKGWKCLYQPASIVYHKGGVSFHKEFGQRRTLAINWRNTFLFMWKNLSDQGTFKRFWLWLPVRMAHALVTFRPEFITGFFGALPRAGKALARRRKLKREGVLQAVPDRWIFETAR